ncbi:MAG: dienelactone hydrolase family protein [Proteobacteria bacterium]|nr:dienelactone hydrolase family protein [Pseudomonadota bacterium]
MHKARLLLLALAAAMIAASAGVAEQAGSVVTPIGSTEQLPVTVMKPDGAGPFPAIVMMHDCSGLGPRSSGAPRRWADELVAQGYVIAIPDSFSPRGFPSGVCTEAPGRARAANGYARAADAYGVLAYVRTLPYVDGKRVAVMGGSHGGWTTLAALYEPVLADNPLIAVKRNGFAAGIALYPSCAGPYGSWATTRATGTPGPITGHAGVFKPIAPLLILIGEKDDWTPAEPCRWLAEGARARGYPVEIKIYPGAHHSFDSPNPVRYVAERNNPNAPSGRGATTGGDHAAWADARHQVAAFLAKHLKSPP